MPKIAELTEKDLDAEVQLPEDELIYGDKRYLGVLVGWTVTPPRIQTDIGWVDVDPNEEIEVLV